MHLNENLKLQLALLDIKYPISSVDFSKINWSKFFYEASNNRLLFYFSNKLIQLELILPNEIKSFLKDEVISLGQQYLNKTKKTLQFLNENLANFDFLICKTGKDIEYVTFDVDVLVWPKDYSAVVKCLSKKNGEFIDCPSKLQGDIIIDDLLRIDLHDNFHWQKSDFIPLEELWRNTVVKEVFGINSVCPRMEIEITLALLNLIYERQYIPLLEYDFILKHQNEIDWKIIFSLAETNGWLGALIKILNKFNQIHYFLFNNFFIDLNKYKKDYKLKKIKQLKIPFIYTYWEGFQIFFERFIKRRYFRPYEFFYFIFAKTRFHITSSKRVPIYGHWINYLK